MSDPVNYILHYLTLIAPNKYAADDILIFYFYLLKKIRLDFFHVNPLPSRGFT